MEKLERVLAYGVLDVLRQRAHVALAPTRADALCDELEAVILPVLSELVEHGDTDRGRELLDRIAHHIAERLSSSDHVDDIFAADNIIQRDAKRVMGKLLVRYIRGELDVEPLESEPGDGNDRSVTVALLELGYLVGEVAKRLEQGMLHDALERAAATVEGRLYRLTPRCVATFEIPSGEASRLPLEDAIAEELVSLIEAELVDLPTVEQVLELADVDCLSPELEVAIERSLIHTRAEYDCVAHCVGVNATTIIATLTPLSDHAAEHADDAFALFVKLLEEELTSPSRLSTFDAGTPRDEVEDQPSSRPASSRRKRKTKEDAAPPRSQPRGRRGAVRAANSSTRQMRARAKRKRAKG